MHLIFLHIHSTILTTQTQTGRRQLTEFSKQTAISVNTHLSTYNKSTLAVLFKRKFNDKNLICIHNYVMNTEEVYLLFLKLTTSTS